MVTSSIFKSYDIRGIYPTELNEETARAIGRAFVAHAGAKKVAVGYDARLSSPALFDVLVQGILSKGAAVYSIGQMPTECIYFTVGHYDTIDAGIMVTASHNPKEYNGFKMVVRDKGLLRLVPGKDIKTSMGQDSGTLQERGKIESIDVMHSYLQHIFSFADTKKIKPFKVVIDASNGVIGKIITMAKDRLPIELVDLNFPPDGNFPNHAPNPLLEGSADQISAAVKKEKAHLGFIFDGDADRVYLITEKGDFVKADITLTLLAKHFLKKHPGAGIALHVTCSKSVSEFIKKWGGVPIRTKVGFINIQQGLIDHQGVMGGELSGHYCFKDNFYSDSGMIAFLTLLQIISEDGRKVSEIINELSVYAKDPEINFEVENKEEIMGKIKETYSDGKQDFLDGVTVEYQDWWFNVRPSNTEPLLRLTVEANTRELLEQKKKELSEFINLT